MVVLLEALSTEERCPAAVVNIGAESERKGTSSLTPRQIGQIIKASHGAHKAVMLPLRFVIDTNVVVSAALKCTSDSQLVFAILNQGPGGALRFGSSTANGEQMQ